MNQINKPNHCFKCNNNSLAFVERNGRRINYESLLGKSTEEIKSILDRYNISHLSCSNCGESYMIDWTYVLPIPMMNEVKIYE